MAYYKVLTNDLQSCHGGYYQWTPGEWTPPECILPYYSGYHLCDGTEQLLKWLGETIWIAEARGEIVALDNKIVVESARDVRAALEGYWSTKKVDHD